MFSTYTVQIQFLSFSLFIKSYYTVLFIQNTHLIQQGRENNCVLYELFWFERNKSLLNLRKELVWNHRLAA